MKSLYSLFFRAVIVALLALCVSVAQPVPAEPPAPVADNAAAPATPPAVNPPVDESPATAAPDRSKTPPARRGMRRLDVEPNADQADEPHVVYRSGHDFPIGDHVVPKGSRINEVVSVMGSTVVNGEVRGGAVSVMGDTTIGPDAKVAAAVAVLGKLSSDGEIRRDAVNVLGGTTINGHVGGKVVSVLGDATFGPKAVVNGDVVIVGGHLNRHPDAVLHGNEINVPVFGIGGDLEWLTTWVKRCLLLGRPLAFGRNLGWAWGVAFSFLAFYLVLSVLFSRGIERCVTTFETRPGSSILAAFLTVLLSPIAIILLVVTVVGGLLVPFLGAALFFAGLFGKTVMLAWLGRRFTKPFGDGPASHPFFAVLIGGVIVMLLYTIWGSFLLYKLLTWLGLGVVVYTILLANKREKPAVAPVDGGVGPEMPPIVPGAPSEPVASAAPLSSTAAPTMSAAFVGGATAPDFPTPPTASASDIPTPVPPTMETMPESGNVPPPVPPSVPPPLPSAATPPPPRVVPPPIRSTPRTVLISAATLPRAGFGIRLAAMLLDVLLVGLVVGFASGLVPRGIRFDPMPHGMLLGLATYAAVMWKHKGTTIGGVICGLKVVRLDQRELDWTTAIVRAVSCFLSLCAVGLGFIWVAFDDEKQSWHDKIAGTTVVRVPKGTSLL